jgi:hypothetical protein
VGDSVITTLEMSAGDIAFVLRGLELILGENLKRVGTRFEMKISRRDGSMGAAVEEGKDVLEQSRQVNALIDRIRKAGGLPSVS